jgi:hypothetical protein
MDTDRAEEVELTCAASMLAISPWMDCILSESTVEGASAVERLPRLGRGRTVDRSESGSTLRPGDRPGDLAQDNKIYSHSSGTNIARRIPVYCR